MESIRLKITVKMRHNHALTALDLQKLKPVVERGVAACLPDFLKIETIKVTRIKEADCCQLPPAE